jgi:hypothetical protein
MTVMRIRIQKKPKIFARSESEKNWNSDPDFVFPYCKKSQIKHFTENTGSSFYFCCKTLLSFKNPGTYESIERNFLESFRVKIFVFGANTHAYPKPKNCRTEFKKLLGSATLLENIPVLYNDIGKC